MAQPRHIEPDGIVPVYRQIADHLAADIRAGKLKPGQRIPSENDVVQEFGVARDTARRAFRALREDGLVITVQGRGTFVSPT